MFDLGVLKSRTFPIPIITVGNLSAGGTGKTPHVEWLLRNFSSKYNVAVLSRGYGRKTKGYLEAEADSTAQQIGDEPLQIHQQFPKVKVVVCEDRVFGIETLLSKYKKLDLIILDDAFQHRYVSAGLNWLLTAWDDPYTRDQILPFGNLREDSRGAERADIITITKAPHAPSLEEREAFRRDIQPTEVQEFSFSRMVYKDLVSPSNKVASSPKNALLITGIAKPEPLKEHLLSTGVELSSLHFSDHRDFTYADVQKIKDAFDPEVMECIITTRKDFVRWPKDEGLAQIPTLIQDIEIEMDTDSGPIYRYIDRFISDFEN